MITHRPPVRAILLDLSGTLHVGSTPTPGAVAALDRLRKHNASHTIEASYPFKFCSNTSKEGRRELEARLRGMGFEIYVEEDEGSSADGDIELWTSLGALSGVLRQRGLRKPLCLLQESAKREVLHDLDSSVGDAGACDTPHAFRPCLSSTTSQLATSSMTPSSLASRPRCFAMTI